MGLSEVAYRRHRDDIQRYLLRRFGDWHDAEELTQAVFAEAVERLPALEQPPNSLLAWLYTVAERRFIDEIRRRSRRRERLHLFYRDEAVEVDYGQGVAEAIGRALAALPAQQRTVVVDRLLDDRPFSAIGAALGISEGAAKMRFTRALNTMREQLAREGIEP